MLKCPACGRTGGPFRLRQQIQVEAQNLRAWACPCGHGFHAIAGAERTQGVQAPYTGFTLDWNGRAQSVQLVRAGKHETIWQVGSRTITVAAPAGGSGPRVVIVCGPDDAPVAELRLSPGSSMGEVGRQMRGVPLPSDLEATFLARVLARILG